MTNVESTQTQRVDCTPSTNTLIIKSIKISNCEENAQLYFSIDYPKLTQDKISTPFALQGWILGGLQIQAIEVSQAGAVVASVPITIHRPDIAKHFNFNEGDDCFGFFSHLNPYFLPENFELQVNAITADAEKILLCTITGQRPTLTTCDLTPLLVTTLGRTGSTALLGTLGMHPEIAVYKPFEQEARYIGYYTQMFKTLSSAYSWQAPLAAISEYVTQDQLIGRGVPSDNSLHYRVYPEMWDNFYHQYVPDLFKLCSEQLSQLYRNAAKLNGNSTPKWIVEKFVPGNEVSEVKSLFPTAKEIILVRDPRDVYCSILSFIEKRGYQGFGRECFQDNHSYLTEAFIPSVMLLYHYWKAHGDSVLLVRYEDMILNPQKTFHRICQHIGVDSTSDTINQMLVKVNETSNDSQKEHRTSSSVANSIGRFKSSLPQGDISLMNESLHEALTAFGYELHLLNKKPKKPTKKNSIHIQTKRSQPQTSVMTENKSASGTMEEKVQYIQNMLLAKNGTIAVQAKEIHRLNSTLVAKDSAITTLSEEIQLLNSVLSVKGIAMKAAIKVRNTIMKKFIKSDN